MKLLAAFVVSLLLVASAQNIDLLEATLNGKPICGMALDELTDELGRPSAVRHDPVIADYLGPWTYFHPLGINFFHGTEEPYHVESAEIRLTGFWDSINNMSFMPYVGPLPMGISGNSKIADVMEAFPTATLQTRDEIEADWTKRGQETGVSPPEVTFEFVKVPFGSYSLTFVHEYISDFLESISLECM